MSSISLTNEVQTAIAMKSNIIRHFVQLVSIVLSNGEHGENAQMENVQDHKLSVYLQLVLVLPVLNLPLKMKVVLLYVT